jgi:hypothetical protein
VGVSSSGTWPLEFNKNVAATYCRILTFAFLARSRVSFLLALAFSFTSRRLHLTHACILFILPLSLSYCLLIGPHGHSLATAIRAYLTYLIVVIFSYYIFDFLRLHRHGVEECRCL